jgi:hypothetical protein
MIELDQTVDMLAILFVKAAERIDPNANLRADIKSDNLT